MSPFPPSARFESTTPIRPEADEETMSNVNDRPPFLDKRKPVGIPIDNSEQAPEETVEEVLRLVAEEKASTPIAGD